MKGMGVGRIKQRKMQNYPLIYKTISIVCHVNGDTFQLHTMLMRNCTQNNMETQSADYFIQEQKDSLCIIQWGESCNLSPFTTYFSPYNKAFSTDSERKGEREGKKLRQLYQKFTKYMQTLCLSWKGNPFRGVNNGHFVGFQMQLTTNVCVSGSLLIHPGIS